MRYDIFQREIGRELQIDPRHRYVEPAIRRAYNCVRGEDEKQQRAQIDCFVDAFRAARTLANSTIVDDFRKAFGNAAREKSI